MTNLSITTVKSEDDIIESFIRHNATFIDIFIVIDNNSSDKTREILLKLQKEGFNIIIFDDPILGRFESQKMTFYYRRVVPIFRPDSVFLLDADEFIVAPSRKHMDAIMADMPKGSIALIPWRTYVLTPENAAQRVYNPIQEIQHRRLVENPVYYKAVISVSPEHDENLVVDAGNHNCHLQNGQTLLTNFVNNAFIAHYPLRNHQQMLTKVIFGWVENIIKNRFHTWKGYGFHKKYLYDRYLTNYAISDEELAFESLYYAQDRNISGFFTELVCHDPLPAAYELIYTDKVSSPALHKIIRGFDRMLAENISTDSLLTENIEKQQYIWADLPPFKYFLEKYSPSSVLDLGCGHSVYLRFFEQHCVTFSESQNATNNFNLDKKFDLVICNILATYDHEKDADIIVENIINHAKSHIIISASCKDDTNNLPMDTQLLAKYLEKFHTQGWNVCLIDSLAMRSLASFRCFRQGLIVLMHTNVVNHDYQTLLQSKAHNYIPAWIKPGIITHPMLAFLHLYPEIIEAQIFSKHSKQQAIADQNLQLLETRALLFAKEQELSDIYGSKAWKLLVIPARHFKLKLKTLMMKLFYQRD